MNTARRYWKDNQFTSLISVLDSLHKASPSGSSEQVTLDKAKRMEGNLSSREFQEESKSKKKEFSSQANDENEEPTVRAKINISVSEPKGSFAHCESSNLDVAAKGSFAVTENHSTWSTKETPVISRYIKKRFIKGISPKIHLNLLNVELEELNLKCRKIEEEFEIAEKELLNSKKAFSVKSLNPQGTTTENKKDWKIQALKNDILEKTANVKNLTEELHQAKEMINHLRIKNRDLKENIKKLRHQNEVGRALIKEEMKMYYKLEMERIHGELDAIKRELKVEKTLQARNNRTLELLRKHFSNTPPATSLDSFLADFF